MSKAETWLSAFKGHQQLDPLAEENEKKQIMLQRFQEEVIVLSLCAQTTLYVPLHILIDLIILLWYIEPWI